MIGVSEIADRYRRLAAAFTDKVAAVPTDRWESPSPCEGWTARDVVGHVVQTQGMFLGFVGRSTPDGPSVDVDPVGAWRIANAAVQADLDDPERASVEFEGHFGQQTFEQAVDRFLSFDLVVHGWDLARAAGLDDAIAEDDLARVKAAAEAFGDAMRGPGAFGPEVDSAADADEQTKLMAFLGRHP
jgi:uncharacterized protein (TIGR03086 family)